MNMNITSSSGVSESSGSTIILIGSIFGAVGFLSLLVVVICLLTVVFVVRKRRRDGDEVIIDDLIRGRGGITNAVYAGDELFDGTGDAVRDIEERKKLDLPCDFPYDYTLPDPKRKDREFSEKNDAYAYASTEPIRTSIKKIVESRKETKDKQSTKHDKEKVYITPAKEESALYAQIVNIRIPELERNAIELGEFLGSGNFGAVCQGLLTSPNGVIKVAVKTLKEGSGEEDRVKFLQEATIMGQFKHPNVVKLHGIIMEDEPELLVLELLSEGDLKKHLTCERYESELSVDEHTLLSYCRQIASGMVYLSNKRFVHRDLAARNILLSEQGLCKIADFGLSRDLVDEEYYVSHGGKIPVKWTSPEAIHYKKYSTASDVWSYGIVVFEIWSIGRAPYQGMSIQEVVEKLEEGYRLPPPPGCPRAIYELMINTWHPDWMERPEFSDIMQQLSLPDTLLLERTEALDQKLGDELLQDTNLFEDLQNIHRFIF